MANPTNLVPRWFQTAIAQESHQHTIVVEDIDINYRTWDRPTSTTQRNSDTPTNILFIHGHAAHSHWWDFIAPAFTNEFQVAAMDMSGNGDSGHREQYSSILFAREILSVANKLGGQTILVGHSFGGMMTRIAAFLEPSMLAGIVLVDSVTSSQKSNAKRPPMPRRNTRYYPDIKTAIRRFRLKPPQKCTQEFIIKHIATHSLKHSGKGYFFGLDQGIFAKMEIDPSVKLPVASEMLGLITCPTAFIYGDDSVFFPKGNRTLIEHLFEPARLINIPEAHHHVFLDQPQQFIYALHDVIKTF